MKTLEQSLASMVEVARAQQQTRKQSFQRVGTVLSTILEGKVIDNTPAALGRLTFLSALVTNLAAYGESGNPDELDQMAINAMMLKSWNDQ